MGIENSTYRTTSLEDWVTNLYKRLGILQPNQLKIEYLARLFGIFIKKNPMPSFYIVNGRYKAINIDSRVSEDIQKEMFFHELCHILRHVGIQSKMPLSFRDFQEWDAKNFTRYAAIPHHMIKYIDLDNYYVIDQMVGLFKVTPELCEERLEQIKNRTRYNIYVAEPNHKYEA
jgi:predicted kinase